MSLPKYIDTNKTERIGVHKVALILSEMGLIFRETSNSDTGVDGQIEVVDEHNYATSRIMAVQIKSGSSYLHDNSDNWLFYVDEAHKNYWRLFPIPVMLIVYNPTDGKAYFIDAKYALNTTEKIEIPKDNILCKEKKELFLKTIGGNLVTYSDIENIFQFMLREKCFDITFPVSYLELFISGLTSLCNDLFFDVSLAIDIAEVNIAQNPDLIGTTIDHNFLWNYINYLVREGLAEINYHACLYDYEYRMIQPRFIAPLTYRGKQLLKYIDQLEQQLLEPQQMGSWDVHIVCESRVNLLFDYPSVIRLKRITDLQSTLLTKMGNEG